MEMEAKAHNQPAYAASLYNPDGIERERMRIARGMAVVQSHPVWFWSNDYGAPLLCCGVKECP
jgi:hypothetical protein